MRQHSAALRAYRGASYCLCNPAWVGSGERLTNESYLIDGGKHRQVAGQRQKRCRMTPGVRCRMVASVIWSFVVAVAT